MSQEIAKRSADQVFRPTSFDEAVRLADMLAKSSLIPTALRNKSSDVLVTLIAGHELGLSPMQSVRSIHIIEGKPTLAAELMVALVKKRTDVCQFFRLVASDAKKAEYETQRQGDPAPTRLAYTIEEATGAGLAGRDNWKKHPAAMLRARASSALARAVYPDLVLNVYDPDEAVDMRERFESEERRPLLTPRAIEEETGEAEPAQQLVIHAAIEEVRRKKGDALFKVAAGGAIYETDSVELAESANKHAGTGEEVELSLEGSRLVGVSAVAQPQD